VYEEDLETVVSKTAGAPVMVVRGIHSGEHGRLVEKTKREAVVQLIDSGEAVQLSLDDLADYTGADCEHW
jgi:ribosomal protein S4E